MKHAFFLLFFALGSLGACGGIVQGATLDSCIAYYENGEYMRTVDSLKVLLPALKGKDEAEAYKYMGFSHAMIDMVNTAKTDFQRLLAKYPNTELDTLTVPPNITAIFNEVRLKSELQKEKQRPAAVEKNISSDDKDVLKGRYVKRPGVFSWTVPALLCAGSGGASAWLFLRGKRLYREYANSTVPDDISRFRTQTTVSFYASEGLAGVCVLSLGYSTFKFFRWKSSRVVIGFDPAGEKLQLSFSKQID